MGQATNAILAYGYDLGGPDAGWRVQETDRWGELADLPWYDPADDDAGFIDQANNALLMDRGSRLRGPDPSDHEITIERYCSKTAPAYLIAARVHTVHRGHIETIDPAQLARAVIERAPGEHLAHALQVLGLTPLADQPAWHLVSYWEYDG